MYIRTKKFPLNFEVIRIPDTNLGSGPDVPWFSLTALV